MFYLHCFPTPKNPSPGVLLTDSTASKQDGGTDAHDIRRSGGFRELVVVVLPQRRPHYCTALNNYQYQLEITRAKPCSLKVRQDGLCIQHISTYLEKGTTKNQKEFEVWHQ